MLGMIQLHAQVYHRRTWIASKEDVEMKSLKLCVIALVFACLSLALALPVISASAGSIQVERPIAAASSLSVTESTLAEPLRQDGALPTPVRAASGMTIPFRMNNDERAQERLVPHLVLYRNGALTANPDERTLIVTASDVEVPLAGVTVTIVFETQHRDYGAPPPYQPITVSESRRIDNTWGVTRTQVVTFVREFTETVMSSAGPVATPTDYFRYSVLVDGVPQFDGVDYAFLMENQEVVDLPHDLAREGATPNELIVHYCDMFPFGHQIGTWLTRTEILDYVHTQLTPAMVTAIVAQTNAWGMGPWSDKWTSWRGEKRLSVALTSNGVWYHGEAPKDSGLGLASISIRAKRDSQYPSLLESHMSLFNHELFHNLQKNIRQQHDNTDGAGTWNLFSEGQADLASSVGQPHLEFMKELDYMTSANGFLRSRLDSSYAKIQEQDPYSAAIYWRFLYERCGGMDAGGEHPASGMAVIRRSLEAPRYTAWADPSTIVERMPTVMDQALEGGVCPAFNTHEESLIAFARAIYALRLDGGRCTAPGIPAGCGFYDPNNLYDNPPLGTVTHSGADQEYSGEINSSFGMDFVDVVLDPAADGQSLTLEFYGAPGADAEFHVQLWKLIDSGEGAKPRRIPTQMTATEVLGRTNADGHLRYVVPAIDTAAYNRLGLIITRVDATESSDPVGEYTIVLHTGADSE